MSDIRAIETSYDGYRFRSRLEARWAVFFNAAGIEYQYEPEGFILEDGSWYLPDFYLPNVILRDGSTGLWVEVKGKSDIPKEDQNKILRFGDHTMWSADDTPGHALLVVGQIPKSCMALWNRSYEESLFWNFRTVDGDWGYPAQFWRAQDGSIHIVGWDNVKKFPCAMEGFTCFDAPMSWARTARFEHGETPAVSKEARRT